MAGFLTAIISGVSIFINAFGVKGINPYIFTGAKNFVVAILLSSIILLYRNFKELKKLKAKDWRNLATIGLIGGSIPFLLFFKGLSLASPAQGSFVHKTMVLWVAVLAMFFLKEKLNSRIIIGSLLLLLGNFFLLKIVSFNLTIGIVLIFIAALFWSSEIIISKHILKKLSGNTVAFGRMFFGSLFILIFLLVTGQVPLVFTLNASQVMWILVTSALLLGYVTTFYNGLKLVKASTAVAVLSLGSVITTVLNLVFFDKLVTISQVLGIVLLVSGVIAFTVSTQTIKRIFPITSRN